MLAPRDHFHSSASVEISLGLHARPATEISQFVLGQKGVTVTLRYGGAEAAGDSPLQILLLCAQFGAVVEIAVEGANARVVGERIKEILASKDL